MNVILLKGADPKADKDRIFEDYKKPDTVFLLDDPTGKKALYQYIEELNLKRNILMRIRIAKELTGLKAKYSVRGETREIQRFSEILKVLKPNEESVITILGDKNLNSYDKETPDGQKKYTQVRTMLAEVIQQLAYLELPLNRIQVCTEKESRDMDRVRVFEKNLSRLKERASAADEALRGLHEKNPAWREVENVMNTVNVIQKNLQEAGNREMTIMVAATKKSGKSVVVNSMIEQTLAPTSLTLPTPNNCIYRRRQDNIYTLDFQDKQVNYHKEYRQEDLKKMRKEIYELFQRAQKNTEAGFAIPDMNLGYVKEQGGFTSYTLYDTPGPDLAGAVGHKEAKERALQKADMVVFLIDFEKHLTDAEVDYLREIRDAFKRKNKFFSLVILVNKLDERFTSEGKNVKSVVYTLDFLRDSLITKDSSFRDVILLGTSALTYYRCINAPRLPGCESLAENDGFQHIKSCIEHLRDAEENESEESESGDEEGDPITDLNFLQNIANSLENHRGQKVRSLEELKDFSGMPNALAYLEYISRNKARQEIINNLLNAIDGQMAKIENLLQFQKLEELLSKNKGELERVRKLLKEWAEKVAQIYDENYPEVRAWIIERTAKNDKDLSYWIATPGEKYDKFQLKYARDEAKDQTRKHMNFKSIVKEITQEEIPYLLHNNLKDAFDFSMNAKMINGQKRTVVSESEIKRCLEESVKKGIDNFPAIFEIKAKEVQDDVRDEYKKTQNFLTELLNDRRKRLTDTVEYYRQEINQNGIIDFDLPSPSFNFQFQEIETQSESVDLDKIKRDMQNTINSLFNRDSSNFVDKKELKLNNKDGFFHLFRLPDMITLSMRKENDINRMCYDQEYVKREMYQNHLREHIAAEIRNSNLEGTLNGWLGLILKSMNTFFEELENEMDINRQSALSYADNAQKVLDNTEDIERNIHEIQERKKQAEAIQSCVTDMLNIWHEVCAFPFPKTASHTQRI